MQTRGTTTFILTVSVLAFSLIYVLSFAICKACCFLYTHMHITESRRMKYRSVRQDVKAQ